MIELIRLTKLDTLSHRALAINAVFCLLILAGAVSYVNSWFDRPEFSVCSERYRHHVRMMIERDGRPMDAAEVESVTNGQDEGVLDNLSVEPVVGGPAKFAMNIRIANGTVEQRSDRGAPGGISLPWTPSIFEQPSAACLSYDIMLPGDFDFDRGGTLPGLFATTSNAVYTATPRIGINPAWQSKGVPDLFIESRIGETRNANAFPGYSDQIPVGRWVHVDQEVVLNTPGQEDGILRMWLDGHLETEMTGVVLRANPDITLAGVASEVYFGGSGTNGQAKKDTRILVTPFDLRWE